MRNRAAWTTVPHLLLASFAILALAQPASALNADYWRGGWRTPLGDEPHIYEFVISGNAVTGVYCRNCSDASTIGFIDGTWNEKTGVDFTVTFANLDGSIASVERQHAMLVEGRLIVTRATETRIGEAGKLILVKDPRGADPGGAPAYHLPPGTPPGLPVARPAVGAGGGGRAVGTSPYWHVEHGRLAAQYARNVRLRSQFWRRSVQNQSRKTLARNASRTMDPMTMNPHFLRRSTRASSCS